MTEQDKALGDRTIRRLRTLASFDQLGAGFAIAAQDLDLRGAGDLLGETQAGHMKLIGTNLYQHLLSSALRKVRGETVDDWSPELSLGSNGFLPQDWIPEVDVRLTLYLRLSKLTDETGLDAFEDELVDRFGPLPAAAERLMSEARLRLAARHAHIARIDAGPAAIALTPRHKVKLTPQDHGLIAKDGRYLLKEAIPEDRRIQRMLRLLADMLG